MLLTMQELGSLNERLRLKTAEVESEKLNAEVRILLMHSAMMTVMPAALCGCCSGGIQGTGDKFWLAEAVCTL